ncbi:Putative ribonuclease H protein At1g65750 [Linum perenne]
MGPPKSDGGEDDMIWGPDPRGRFSIKSAYDIRAASEESSQTNTWKLVWKWEGPETLLKWIPAPDDWITVNCDGSVIHPHGQAAAGGIIRDSSGRRLAVFAANLGTCTITRAELRAAAIGLELAWEMQVRKVHLQTDSSTSVLAITNPQQEDSRHGHILQHIRQLMQRNWMVTVSHIYRERNRVADLLAHHGHSLSLGSHFNFVCSSDIERATCSDIVGVCFPRLISSNE